MSILNATQCHVIMPFINNVLYVDYELITCRNPLLHLHGYTSTCPKIFHCLKHILAHFNICYTHVAKIYCVHIIRDFIIGFLKSIDILRSNFLLWFLYLLSNFFIFPLFIKSWKLHILHSLDIIFLFRFH